MLVPGFPEGLGFNRSPRLPQHLPQPQSGPDPRPGHSTVARARFGGFRVPLLCEVVPVSGCTPPFNLRALQIHGRNNLPVAGLTLAPSKQALKNIDRFLFARPTHAAPAAPSTPHLQCSDMETCTKANVHGSKDVQFRGLSAGPGDGCEAVYLLQVSQTKISSHPQQNPPYQEPLKAVPNSETQLPFVGCSLIHVK